MNSRPPATDRERDLLELIDTLPQAVFEADLRGNLTFGNRSALDMFGFTADDLQAGVNIMQVVAPHEREMAQANIGRRLAGGPPEHTEYTGRRRDGSDFPILIYAVAARRDGEVIGLRGLIVDITARKKTESVQRQLDEELLKVQKLDSIGMLAGGIAHDFNNILTAVVGNVSLARMRLDQPDLVAQCLENAERASLRARDLTWRLLTFSRGGEPVRRPIHLHKLGPDAATFALAGSRVRGDYAFPADLWPVDADEMQLLQVIHNLVLNAVQAMPNGGVVKLAATNTIVDRQSPMPIAPGRYVQVTIADQGCGIDADQVARIFEPFFTTKSKGSGLGLTICYSVIRRHGGHIVVESKPDHGTTVTLLLPATAPQPTANAAPATPLCPGRGRVLLMDDEELVRATGTMLLTELGYEVVTASDGTGMLGLFTAAQAEKRGFDVVILDLTVPGGMGGEEACRRLHEIAPQARTVVASGYANSPVMAMCRDFGFVAAIAKPYDIQQIGAVLQEVLGDRRIA